MKRAAPVVCREPLGPLTAVDVIAHVLAMVRGRVFGRRSVEVELLRMSLRNAGFDIYHVAEAYRLSVA